MRVTLAPSGGMETAAILDVPGQGFAVIADDTHLFVGTEGGLLTYPRDAPTGSKPAPASS